MSTSCLIAKKQDDGYKTIYCHHDGYPSYMLNLLKQHYNNEDRIEELLSLGDASVLTEKLYPTTPWHSFDRSEDGVSVFYGRDRGEDNVQAAVYSMEELKRTNNDYVYIFDKEWKMLWE